MKARTTKNLYYKISDPKNLYGLIGSYETPEEALEYINESYNNALKEGYDNRQNKWIIVCVEHAIVRDEHDNFLREDICRYTFESVEFSTYENKFVFVY